MKIGIVGLLSSPNLGEEFCAKSLAYIIKNTFEGENSDTAIDFVYADIAGSVHTSKGVFDRLKSKYIDRLSLECYYLSGVIVRKVKNIKLRNMISAVRHRWWNHGRLLRKAHWKYFEKELSDVSLIVLAGAGMLEYSYNEYQELLSLLVEFANKKNIPMVCNAIGKAGECNPKDFRYKVLKKAFSSKSIKYISARDSVDVVQQYAGDQRNVKLLADAAFCADEAYNIKARVDRTVIGIGIIRGDAMSTYAHGMNENELCGMFVDIANLLRKRGYEYQFFTNGLMRDYTLGLKVIKQLGVEASKYLVVRPTKGIELMKTISSYEGMIVCRMHASIAGFSMGIPSVILSWNDKVDKYMSIVGHPDWAIKQQEFSADYIVNKLEEALKTGISSESRQKMKDLARESVEDFLGIVNI